ncbi:hypothetical protein QBC46DRAFT_363840 [Diplogelasinospora grovesii]|uniref:Fungal specific transcription factor n=1 Tax=Diplogelasinospora grovesii TaxID=303347 RepID=A0AAN6N807_9PEZI|nr:hypothetical protein QBC46DRAFT_363840 [Diplogelasinospora grovesii]
MRGLASSRHAPGHAPRANFYSPNYNPNFSSPNPDHKPDITLQQTVNPVLPPSTPTTTTNKPPPLPARAELQRYGKIVRRLQWKLDSLSSGYHKALSARTIPGQLRPGVVNEAELMFKLDFFDYYMHIERALVHMQGVFGVQISRDHPQKPGLSGHPRHHHRFHANVLEALDNESNPLHTILGVGDVRRCLARAKDLRNRWKSVSDDRPEGDNARWQPAPLESYDLERILQTIFDGFDKAYVKAEEYVRHCEQQHVARAARGGGGAEGGDQMMDDDGYPNGDLNGCGGGNNGGGNNGGESGDEGWEFMVDAMDWEAI